MFGYNNAVFCAVFFRTQTPSYLSSEQHLFYLHRSMIYNFFFNLTLDNFFFVYVVTKLAVIVCCGGENSSRWK